MYCISATVRPRLSGHIRTGAYPDKRFVRIWEFKHSKFSKVYRLIMYVLIATVFVANYHSHKMDIHVE